MKDLLKSDDVDIVLNLTIPEAHAEVSLQALEAGKHVYSEKPLATTVADGVAIVAAAKARGLRVGAAPDTVLGAGVQEARALIDAGAIGKPLTGLAAVMSHGMEHWHPNPGFFFRPGAGPVFDMGPYYLSALVTLLGPVASVQATGQIGFEERIVTTPSSPVRGQSIKVETLTNVHALLDFASGAHVTFLASWDVWKHGMPPIELHGQKASLRLPDPNWFGGDLLIAGQDEDWRTIRPTARLSARRTGRRQGRSSPTTAASAWLTWRARSSTDGLTAQRRNCAARARGHGGDSRGGGRRPAGCDFALLRTAGSPAGSGGQRVAEAASVILSRTTRTPPPRNRLKGQNQSPVTQTQCLSRGVQFKIAPKSLFSLWD